MFEFAHCIFIDGRNDATLTMFKENRKYFRQTIHENHYVVVGEPVEFYLFHISPQDGKRKSIAERYLKLLMTPL